MGNIWWVHSSWQLRVVLPFLFTTDLCPRTLHRAILHDEEIYPEPFKFNPDRFLTKDGQLNPAVQDPALAVFGFGRRFDYPLFSMCISLLDSSR